MKIDGKVHCFFEQSGTFKNEFIKLGIPAEDYDIQNNFGETENLGALESLIIEEYSDLSLCMVITEYGLSGKVYRYGNHGNYWEEIGETCGYA